ncbi:protein NRT1/ PTR FAMILY 1.2-like [Arachis stenosperma]|uniref:protein NRT1/ PTR FAMILY 1.2-like n=1 Tax=Arachis stenosperma TaxID=217475 RepID=UPI0025ABBF73|nr:protein NRT1/ PTR FAMILY 1.2-like [Arachis stenosperma]
MNNNQRCKGGLITMPFIIGNEALAKMASVGLTPNMILYLIGDYRLRVVKATKIMFFWFAATNFAPLFGAFLADSYLGRFLAIAFGSIITFLGMALLWLTAMIAEARPSPLSHESATAPQIALLITCFALISIGGGGIFCSLAFGADQLNNNNNNKKEERVLESFISWYIASQAVSVVFSLTAIVYIQDRFGWKLGFGVPAALMLLSTVFFFLLSHRYVKHKPHKSLLTSFAQVIVVAFKNRKLQLPPTTHHPMLYHHNKDSTLVAPSHKLRFLNKACIITNNNNNSSWSVCTIEQVEELKAIIKVIPLWSSGFMLSISSSQSSFFLLQAKTMNRHITSSFQIPAGSFSVFIMISVFITAAVYDRLIIPLASKLRGKPVRISAKNRMGIGLFFCFLDLVVSAVVENIRRRKAIREGYIDNPEAVLDMSAMWLIPHNVLNGIAEAFNAIGQSEFYYTEFPRSMSSIAAALFSFGSAIGNLLASLIFSIVDDITSRKGKQSWVSDNINKGHYDKYYWVLAIMGAVNMVYYLVCNWAYGPTIEDVAGNRVHQEEEK